MENLGISGFIAPSSRVGENTIVATGAFISSEAYLGAGSILHSGAHVGVAVSVGEGCVIGANATLEGRVDGERASAASGSTWIESNVKVGASATILWGIRVGSEAEIRPGSVVTMDVPSRAIVEGNPAKIIGYVGQSLFQATDTKSLRSASLPGGAIALSLPLVRDLRGDLSVFEFPEHISFTPKRFFCVFNVGSRHVRGEHAHLECTQILVALHGSLKVLLDDGFWKSEISLSGPTCALLIPPMVWSSQFSFSPGAVLGVFASHVYDESDYIRNYSEFRVRASSQG